VCRAKLRRQNIGFGLRLGQRDVRLEPRKDRNRVSTRKPGEKTDAKSNDLGNTPTIVTA